MILVKKKSQYNKASDDYNDDISNSSSNDNISDSDDSESQHY